MVGHKPAIFTLILALGAFATAQVGCTGDDSPSGSQTIRISGAVIQENGAPVDPQAITFSVRVGGNDLFTETATCETSNHFKQAIYEKTLNIDYSGRYELSFSMAELKGFDDDSCRADATSFSSVTSVRVELALPGTYANCQSFCRAHAPDAQSSCLAECTTAGRTIGAQRIITDSELDSRLSDREAAVIELADVKLVLDRVSAGISNVHGPDLQVNGLAAATSARISYESFSSASCAVQERCLRGTGLRKLLRFDGVLMNLGDADFELGSPIGNPLFEFSACHGHYHLKEAMRYELLSEDGMQAVMIDGESVVGRKQGFCMIDMQRVAGSKPRQYTCSFQGLTSGWSDIYDGDLDCQWLDITGVPAGNYRLRVTVNPNGTLEETLKTNNSSDIAITIPAE